jgi:hypothetical protein
MRSTYPTLNSVSDLATGNGNDVTPFSQQSVVLTKQAYIELTWEANYWRAQPMRLLEREAALKAEVETLHATIRDLNQRLYGAKSEQAAGCDTAGPSKSGSPRNRGQQPCRQGHGRSDRSALPVVAEVHDVSAAATHGPNLW